MAGENISPNMSLPVPGVGVTTGPLYATDLNACLSILDAHTHAAGSGVPITPNGLNISSDLSFLDNNATRLRSVRLTQQAAALALSTDLGCIYNVLGDLYYRDGVGNSVRITQSGGVAGSPGSISNLVSPASAAYVAISTAFVWQSAANTSAKLDSGAHKIRNLTASSNYVELAPPASIPADYTLTLPNLPTSQKIMTLDNSGNMTAPYTVNGTTVVITSNVIGVGTINGDTNITAASITGSTQLVSASVSQAKLAAKPLGAGAGAISFSTSTGVVANASGTEQTYATAGLTTTGRPVRVEVVPDGTANPASFICDNGGSMIVSLYRDSTLIAAVYMTSPFTPVYLPPSSVATIDAGLAAGTYSYTLRMANSAANGNIRYVKLLVYEI